MYCQRMSRVERSFEEGSRSDVADVAHEPSFFRPDIQGMRALAVALVILAHAGVPGFEGGYIGVDVFFVISGYVITGLLLRQPSAPIHRNLGHFYARRIRRIVPAATLALVGTTFAAYWFLGANFNTELLGDVRWAALFSANFRLIHTGSNYFIPGIAPSLVTHFWSLAVEEQFYLVYPLVVFTLSWRATNRQRLIKLAVFLAAAILISGWWSHHLTTVNPVTAYYSPFTRFWEIALGSLVSLAPVAWARRTPQLNAAAGFVAFVVILVVAVRLNDQSVYPGVLAWWPCAATAVLLYTGQSSSGGVVNWLSYRPCRYVGDISYSLYLWHFVWFMLPAQMVHPPAGVFKVVELAGAFACAAASYHLVENPIRRSKNLSRDGWAVVMLLVVCLAVSWDATLIVGHMAHQSFALY